MKKLTSILLFSIFVFLGFNSVAQNDCLKKFSWLGGTWKTEDKESVIIEEWSEAETSLECESYEVKSKDTTMIETSTISCIGGQYFFTYHPVLKDAADKKQSVSFIMISEKDNTFIFENKGHDFPQRVVYQNVSENECHAWIEGEEKGKENRIDFFYKRIK